MHARDLLMFVCAVATMYAGAVTPQLAESLSSLPRLLLMIMLFQGFLAVNNTTLWQVVRARPGEAGALVLLRLVLLPVIVFALSRLAMPEFALSGLLYGAAPVGVMAGVFSLMLRVDTALILVANIVTSLLLPLSLPFMLLVVSTALGWLRLPPLPVPEHLSLGGMTLSLCVTILVPFFAAGIVRACTGLRTLILRNQYWLSLACVSLTNFTIFCQYSELLHQSPRLLLRAFGFACALSLVMTLLALPLVRRMKAETALAYIISFGIINNILMMILCLEFFSMTEALVGAAYLIPVYGLLLYYRHAASRRGIDGS
jgi:BASS family bile acid:Na+ symporter